MSAYDDGQADETARGGALRRLPDPPSLVRAREAARRGAEGGPEAAPPSGAPADEDRAEVDEDRAEVGEDLTPADEDRAAADHGYVSSAASGGTGTDRLSDFEPGLVASRPPGGAPVRSHDAAPPEAAPEPGSGTSTAGTDEPTAVLPVFTDDAPATPPPGGAAHGPAPTAASGPRAAHSPAADEPTAVLPVFTDGAPPGHAPDADADAAAASGATPVGDAARASTSGPSQPASPPAPPAPPAPSGAVGSVAGHPAAPPPIAGTGASPGPPIAPPPYSGGPYAPSHGQPQPPQYRQQQHPHPAGQQPAHPQAAPYRAVPARVSVPVVGPELAGTEGKVRHGDTFARRTGRYLKRLLPSASDAAAVAAAVQAVQQPLASGRQIAVTSIRGGSGKSTVAALLALTFAHHRTDPVIAVEADPALGTLPRRLGATEVRWSCADLARILDPSMQITDLIGYLLPFSGGGWLLPGSQGTVGAQLDLDTYRIVMTAMRRYFAATVVDCQTLPAEVARTALTTTQARVLVAPATVEGVAATRTVLEWLGKLHRSMLPTTVVALTHTTPDSTLDVRRSTELLQQGGAYVITLPYDRHLAGGGAIVKDLLALETQEAATRLGGAVMDRATLHGS